MCERDHMLSCQYMRMNNSESMKDSDKINIRCCHIAKQKDFKKNYFFNDILGNAIIG